MASTFQYLSQEVRDALKSAGIERPTPPQAAAILHVLRGENILLIASTGSGKTEAALLPIFDLLCREQERQGISILYITPLRALNRDMLRRIETWAEVLNFTVEVRHGDTPQRDRRRQSARPPDMLITTPETLLAILPGRIMRSHLQRVKWVVVDELHQLVGNRRGVQMAVALERLRRLAGDFQVVGLSATVGNPSEVASFLAGSQGRCRVLDVATDKEFRYYVEMPEPIEDDYELARLLYTSPEQAAVLNRMEEIVEEHKATLIFVNSRVNAETLVSKFNLFTEGIGLHHGSLPKEERVRVEEDFKRGKHRALVCTSTLELGIDIGLVDFVVQYMSPRQVSALVQRVGRSGHTLDRVSEGVILVFSTDDLLESVAAAGRARRGKLEPISIPRSPMDVLAHQTVGCALDHGGIASADDILSTIQGAYPYRDLDMSTLSSVLGFLEKLGAIRIEDGAVRVTPKGRRYYFENLSTIPDERLWPVVDVTTQQKVGLLGDEFMAKKARVGLNFVVRGRPWRMEKIAEDGYVYVTPVSDPRALVARWDGELLPVPRELAQEVGALRRRLEEVLRGGVGDAAAELRKEWPAEKSGIVKVLKEVRSQLEMGAPIPTDRLILAEGFDRYVVIHTHLGDRLNQTLGRVLEALLSGENLLRFWWSDGYRVLLELTVNVDEVGLDDLITRLFGLGLEDLDGLLELIINDARSLGYHMKFIAERFGALERGLFLGPERLHELALRFQGTPVYEEAVRELSEEELDLRGLRDLYQDLHEGRRELRVWSGRKPLPLGYLIVRRYIEAPELFAPEAEAEDNLERMRRYLEHEMVNLLCMECAHLQEGLVIKDLPERPRCLKCGSALLGLAQWWSDHLRSCLIKKLAREKLGEEDSNLLARTRQSADMVLSYGRRAIIAQCVYGIGPQTASRILARMHDSEEDFYRDLMDAKMTFITTRPYWDRR